MHTNACRSAVLDAVEALPDLERETLALVFYRGMSCDEVAAKMKTTVDVVRVRLHAGSRTLLAGVGCGL
ncbi:MULTISPECIES: RNA polymerase sigma factor [unclassified Rhodococcus (in: high G+C Gram-positive bacteria)]|uniref:RNA polymerase sigma factor n=1 Tax=unclassified Rhodococcus (in: high G+C Gram-positive bacteria) TaxID=192944 RepID=UPI001639804E|nr:MULTISPECIES: sigma-70 family RNA polymerase sigma factor [unclassified Rhodococcus (in: high G+C Gram-positive bacteria)]MBC2642293.1 sigma-70 family RNA polymerase sigma factor [Rhodococcus sp. 3A]MBC2892964.1 sigma-70 family RNA polymerase sigma factor [Rhodococcus sp. 4CII]